MKLHLLILNFLFVLPLIGIGQMTRFEVSGETGTNVLFIWANKNENNTEQPRFGLSTGLSFRYNLHPNFSVETNPAIDRKRSYASKATIDEEPDPYLGSVDIVSQYDCLTIPIRVRYCIGRKVKFFVSTGPYFSYMFGLSLLFKYENGSEVGPLGYTGFYKQFEFGISSGIGLAVPITNFLHFHLEVRNNTGLNDIGNGKSAFARSRKTNTIVPLLGMTYAFGKAFE
ncbi:MAG: PorT family protein [Flavobacteriales bacterium]|nr:PorT family protein [Flavobacteriales bacterium]